MAMTILNNTASMMTLGELNKNITKVGKDLRKLSTGERLPNAGAGASDYAISEKMRAQIRALEQDIRNVQNGKSLMKIASGGVDDIVDELRALKELALNSCNDHNTDEDRKILQKEFDARKAHIDSVASEPPAIGKKPIAGLFSHLFKFSKKNSQNLLFSLIYNYFYLLYNIFQIF